MIRLRDKDNGNDLGSISEEGLAFLQAQLEEESESDADYYINADLVETWKEAGNIPPALLGVLEQALSGREGFEIEWSEE